ncbi:MAG: efflux RND transporter periplasmic adaptor subunit [Kofleriaceae bacterium]
MRTMHWIAFLVLAKLAACKGDAKSADKEETSHDEKGHEDGEKGHDEKSEKDRDEKGRHEGGVIHLRPEQIKAANIQIAKVEIRKETAVLEANGQIGAADDRQARVGVRVPGRVTALKASVGDVVKKGQTLAIVESPELGKSKADYVSASAAARLARENATRERLLFERKISAEVEWRKAQAEAVRTSAELQAAENRLHALGVSDSQLPDKVAHFTSTFGAMSPIAGVVVERPVTLGEMVNPENTLFLIMDLIEVWLQVDVFERDISQIALGQNVTVTVTAYPTEKFTGKVGYIGAVVEPRSRAVKVRIALANPNGRLKPGMFARVSLADTNGDEHEHLFVPVSAVQRTPQGTVVFVPGDEPGEFVPRPVKTGHEAQNSVAIESGLTAGEHVVISGSFVLKSELGKESLGESGHSH